MLLSTYRRRAESVAVLCGARPLPGGGLQVDLALIAPHAPRTLAFRPAEGGPVGARLILPPHLVNQPTAGAHYDVTLEVDHAEAQDPAPSR